MGAHLSHVSNQSCNVLPPDLWLITSCSVNEISAFPKLSVCTSCRSFVVSASLCSPRSSIYTKNGIGYSGAPSVKTSLISASDPRKYPSVVTVRAFSHSLNISFTSGSTSFPQSAGSFFLKTLSYALERSKVAIFCFLF